MLMTNCNPIETDVAEKSCLPYTKDQTESRLMTEAVETSPLSNRDRDIFLALLDADPEPTEAAKKAAVEFKKGWHEGDVYHFQLPARRTDADSNLDE